MAALTALAGLFSLALGAYAWAWRSEARRDRIVALLYHRLVDADEFERFPPRVRNFTIPAERFREHLRYLKRAGYSPVGLDQLVESLATGAPLPPSPVLVSFDDGCQSVVSRALPILQEQGFPAALFVTTDPDAWIFREGPDAQPRLTEAELRQLDAAGVSIGSHAVSHDALQGMHDADLERELGESKRYLESVLGKRVDYFGVPLNWYGRSVREAAIRVGYRAVCTSDSGTIRPGADLFSLRRLNVEGWMTEDDLHTFLRPGTIVQRRVIAFLKRFPARVVGPRIWLPFRRWLFDSPVGPLLTLRNLRRLLIGGALSLLILAGAIVWLAV